MPEINLLQQKVLKLFKDSSLKDQFYWTGGTLLSAMYLHHRQSKDLDFFSDKTIDYSQVLTYVLRLKDKLKLTKVEQTKIFDRYEFFLHNRESLRLEFVFYPHPRLKTRNRREGIYIDSLDDIAANKMMAFFDRNDPKDLFDLYFILKKKRYKVSRLVGLVKKKFGVEFAESTFWSECYKSFKDLANLRPLLLANTSKAKDKIIKEVKNYFINQSTRFLHRIIE
jgi:predicted nucleotidyltransferase component of viral defense system